MTDRKKHINRLMGFGASVLLIAVVAGMFASFGFLEKHHLTSVEFTVLDMTSENSLMDSADVQYPLAQLYPHGIIHEPIDSISLQAIEEQYKANPFVRDCRTYIDKHYRLQVEVVERVPLVRIYSHNKGDYYIDREGIAMPVSGHFTPRTLLATGYIPLLPLEHSVDSIAIHQKLFSVAQAIEKDDFMKSFVNEIRVDQKGQILMHPIMGDFTIRITRIIDLEKKFENLKIFLRDGLSRLGWDRYRELVIDYDNQIIAKKIVNP